MISHTTNKNVYTQTHYIKKKALVSDFRLSIQSLPLFFFGRASEQMASDLCNPEGGLKLSVYFRAMTS